MELRALKTSGATRRAVRLLPGEWRGLTAAPSNLTDTAFSSFSHELRSPLNAILGYSSLLIGQAYGELTDAQRKALDCIHENTRSLTRVVEDLLTLYQLDAEMVHPIVVQVDPRQVVRAAADAFADAAARKGLAFEAEQAEPFPAIFTDIRRLSTVLARLLDNAIKFTEQGRVVIGVGPGQEPDRIAFRVSDTGIGIPPHALHRVFDVFYQVDMSDTRQYAGSGLGLPVVAGLVSRLGGTLEVESTLGQGSVFTILLPLDGPEAL